MTAERFADTVTVTSFEKVADPQVGVDVQTTYHTPEPKLAPVGVYVLPVCPLMSVIVPPDKERLPHWRDVIVPPPVSATVKILPVPVEQILCAVVGVILTAVRSPTITVTSLETVGDPQVGVDVHTIYHVPAPRSAPVGVYVLPVCPLMSVIVSPEAERFPH